MYIGLIDVDGHNFPNLCLMKISAYHKSLGDTVEWYLREQKIYDRVYMSRVFKVADRIAGAIVDIAYAAEDDPKIAVEALVGHGVCHVIIETTARLDRSAIAAAIARIAGPVAADIVIVEQDKLLSENQSDGFRCGDNGIFKGVPLTEEQLRLSGIARSIFERYPCDGKYILDGDRLIICQSSATAEYLKDAFPGAEVNPPSATGPAERMWIPAR